MIKTKANTTNADIVVISKTLLKISVPVEIMVIEEYEVNRSDWQKQLPYM